MKQCLATTLAVITVAVFFTLPIKISVAGPISPSSFLGSEVIETFDDLGLLESFGSPLVLNGISYNATANVLRYFDGIPITAGISILDLIFGLATVPVLF